MRRYELPTLQSLKAHSIGGLLKKIKKNRFSFRGLEVEIHPDTDPSIAYLIWKGRYESSECNFVQRYLKPGMKVVELGASTGLVSALIQRQIGPKGRHIAVEANFSLIPFIHRNAGLGVETVFAAIDYSGANEVRFSTTENTLGGRLCHEGASDGAALVPTTTLGKILSEYDLSGVVLIMDIEGAEYDVIKNDRSALLECSAIIVEVHPSGVEQPSFSEEEFFELLKEAGFSICNRLSNVVYFTRNL